MAPKKVNYDLNHSISFWALFYSSKDMDLYSPNLDMFLDHSDLYCLQKLVNR